MVKKGGGLAAIPLLLGLVCLLGAGEIQIDIDAGQSVASVSRWLTGAVHRGREP